ncbi:hypothetical protein D9M72_592520 [compost metagenome]
MLQRYGPDKHHHQQGNNAENNDLQPEVGTGEVSKQPRQRSAAKHDEEEVQRQHFHHGERQEYGEPQCPPVLAKPFKHVFPLRPRSCGSRPSVTVLPS